MIFARYIYDNKHDFGKTVYRIQRTAHNAYWLLALLWLLLVMALSRRLKTPLFTARRRLNVHPSSIRMQKKNHRIPGPRPSLGWLTVLGKVKPKPCHHANGHSWIYLPLLSALPSPPQGGRPQKMASSQMILQIYSYSVIHYYYQLFIKVCVTCVSPIRDPTSYGAKLKRCCLHNCWGTTVFYLVTCN